MSAADGVDPGEHPWIPTGLAQLFEVVLDAAAKGRALNADERQLFFDTGSGAADAGATLGLAIDAYLRGAGQLWEQLFADGEGATQTVELGRTLREISEAAVAALADGFEVAQRRSIRVEVSERRDLLDALLSPASLDMADFERRSARVGFPRTASYVVGVVDPAASLLDGGHQLLRLQRELSQRYPNRRWASAVVRHKLVVIAPDTEPGELGVLARITAAEGEQSIVGVGDRVVEPDDIFRSYEQAVEALRLAVVFGLGPVVHHRRLVVYRLLAADRTVTDTLVDEVLAVLLARSNDSLLSTLVAFVECNGNRSEVARALSVGTRTVGYRLDRIGELTGHSVTDPEGRLTLELAVRSLALAGHGR